MILITRFFFNTFEMRMEEFEFWKSLFKTQDNTIWPKSH